MEVPDRLGVYACRQFEWVYPLGYLHRRRQHLQVQKNSSFSAIEKSNYTALHRPKTYGSLNHRDISNAIRSGMIVRKAICGLRNFGRLECRAID
jgi:hypothetical protein